MKDKIVHSIFPLLALRRPSLVLVGVEVLRLHYKLKRPCPEVYRLPKYMHSPQHAYVPIEHYELSLF